MSKVNYKIKSVKSNNSRMLIAASVILILSIILGGVIYAQQSNRRRIAQEVIPVANTVEAPSNTVETTTPEPTAGEAPIEKTTDKTVSTSFNSNMANSQDGPAKPYGTFVSNHHPSLSGSGGVPSSIQSTCQGTPGAKCQIIFTKDGKTKSLPEKTIGSHGSVSWDWDVEEAGFTAGSWQIKAVSSLNGKSAEAMDDLAFEVRS